MQKNGSFARIAAGALAGTANGLFGGGGGMVLVPLLSLLTTLEEKDIFASSIAIILPICLVSLIATELTGTVAWRTSLPWLIGSAAGGLLAGFFGKKIPTLWLHRGLGVMILWGGIRYLCSCQCGVRLEKNGRRSAFGHRSDFRYHSIRHHATSRRCRPLSDKSHRQERFRTGAVRRVGLGGTCRMVLQGQC